MTESHHVDLTRGCRGYEEHLTSNWNGNVHFGGTPVIPGSVEELCDVVRCASGPVRVVGRGHSFSPLAECKGGTLISLARLNKILEFCPPSSSQPTGSITIEGGTTYTEVARYLGKRGALQNLPSCPQFTVAGAIATATHGSGVRIPNLAAQVSMIEFVKGDGMLVRYSRDGGDDEARGKLLGCRVHLGCLGVVSRLSLDVVPFYEVETVRYDDVPLENMIQNLSELWRSCDSLSVWTSGFGHGHGAGLCWMTFRHFIGTTSSASQSKQSLHKPLPGFILGDSGRICTGPVTRYCAGENDPVDFFPTGRGPWYEALSLTLCDTKETSMVAVDLQAEFFVPLQYAQEAIRAVWEAAREWSFSSPWGYSKGDPIKGLVDAMEFREVKGGDGGWLSPQPVDSLGIHISFNGDPAYRTDIYNTHVPALEEALEPFGARAHWGKLAPQTFQPARLEKLYGQELQKFRELCKLHDPNGRFSNKHTDRMFFNQSSRL